MTPVTKRLSKRKAILGGTLALTLLLGACAPVPGSTQESTTRATLDPSTVATQSLSNPSPTANQNSLNLTVWLPPAFDPNGGGLAAGMLQNRLDEFAEQHPQVRLEVRIKAEEGTGGLLDSLLAAKSAAPLALPDLVLMPHFHLTSAVARQLLFPLTGLTETLDSDDWYTFAHEFSQVDNASYGMPFAADAFILAYRPAAVTQVPSTWQALLDSRLQLGFAAADPDASFTLAQLHAFASGSEQEGDEVDFNEETLTAVFNFFTDAQQQGVFPFWLSQYQTTEQSWQAFSEGRVPMVATWTSRAFDNRNVDISTAPLPTPEGEPLALVKGWVWAVSTPDSDRAALVAELVEFLTTPEFIAQWTDAAGLIPPRHSSLSAWSPGDKQTLASQIVDSAAALPGQTIVDLWGNALTEAVVAVLKEELTSEEAVQQVLERVANP
ncbi:MAG: extracellular solute-binding protein [Anaerolineales bacterium]